ncbi:MAG: two-component system regulatory protein YycI [Methanosarcinaceae archaeon]|nr:two-component system regulatory protein YycI [Methanosarcinaceae archaeon]
MNYKYLGVMLLVIIATAGLVFISSDDIGSVSNLGQTEDLVINTRIPAITGQFPCYKVLSEDREKVSSPDIMDTKDTIPSEKESLEIASQFIEKHGGLPEDAYFYGVESLYLKQINKSGGEPVVEAEHPLMVEVIYKRSINGMPVVGPGDTITISLGENGEVTSFSKSWRILEEIGTKEVISGEEAIEKLKAGQIMRNPIGENSPVVEVHKAELGYFSATPDSEQEYYEPVWIFKGVARNGDNVTRIVEGLAK